MPLFFNNCRGREHGKLFGNGAFYDLNTVGRQATMAGGLQSGAECVVATPASNGNIVFDWYSFSHERVMPGESGEPLRVFFGTLIKSEQLSKSKATRTEPYDTFFNINGNFKRPSVIKPRRKRKRTAEISFGM